MTNMKCVRDSLTFIGPSDPNIIECDVYISPIEPKVISGVLNWIKNKITFEQFSHLKRVKKEDNRMVILLCKVSEYDQYKSLLLEKSFDFSKFEIYKIPLTTPTTSKQFEKWNKVWPLARPITNTDIDNEEYVNRLTNEDLERSVQFMSLAFQVANEKESVSDFQFTQKENVGGVIIDPETNKIIASAFDERDKHPLHHCVMILIEKISKIQRESTDNFNYLCNGYDLYITREPCCMVIFSFFTLKCAMALVHSRIRRVFYCKENKEYGGFEGQRIHHLHQLNHRFKVIKGLYNEEYYFKDKLKEIKKEEIEIKIKDQ